MSANKRPVGLHIRVDGSLIDAARKAVRLSLDLFQCFLLNSDTNRLLMLTPAETDVFVSLHTAHFPRRYVHASYLVNLADAQRTAHPLLVHELRLAKQYGFTHMIFHAGFTKGADTKAAGIEAVARVLNRVMRVESQLQIVLENTAFGSLAVGSDLQDFAVLLQKLYWPDAVTFCIDTAHAHAYGYDIITPQGREDFIALIDATIGIDRVHLIHLNDTYELRGAQKDRHQIVGEGQIGWDALQAFAMHSRLAHVPLLMELPAVSEEKERTIVERVRSWQCKNA